MERRRSVVRSFWLARARHEITVYRALPALAPLPVTVPDMVAEPIHPLIVVTALAGDPVHPHRYFAGTIHSGRLAAVLGLLDRVHAWRLTMPSALPYDDYPGQLAAVRGPEISDVEHPCDIEFYTAIHGRLGVELVCPLPTFLRISFNVRSTSTRIDVTPQAMSQVCRCADRSPDL